MVPCPLDGIRSTLLKMCAVHERPSSEGVRRRRPDGADSRSPSQGLPERQLVPLPTALTTPASSMPQMKGERETKECSCQVVEPESDGHHWRPRLTPPV